MDKNSLQEYGWIVIIVIILACLIVFVTPFSESIVSGLENVAGNVVHLSQNVYANVNKLKRPQNPCVTDEGTSYVLSFDPVQGADSYIVFINDEEKIVTTETTVDIGEYLDGLTGAVTVEVVATDSSGKHGDSPRAKYKHRLPGLYETGTYDLIKSWETLLAEGVIAVLDGEVTTPIDFNTPSNISGDVLDGDLIIAPGVTKLGEYAFALCSNLTEVIVPHTVTDMGMYAFGMCSKLEKIRLSKNMTAIPQTAFMQNLSLRSIEIPDSVTVIDSFAFYMCESLESVYIGSGVASIGEMAFWCCGNMDRILVSPNNTTYHSYDNSNCIIETATKTLVLGCKGSVIPTDGSVTVIGANAFYMCIGLKEISLPESVSSIEESAFYACQNLKTVDMSLNIKSIGDSAFRNCEKLEGILLPEGLESIGSFSFAMCRELASVTIPSTVSVISSSAFQECYSFSEIVIPEGVTTLEDYAFGECLGAKTISISSTATNIHERAFFQTPELESITISDANTVYHVKDNCLIKTAAKSLIYGCKNSIIPDDGSVTHIENYAFQECSGLKQIYIPKEISRIEVEAFKRCGYLESIVVEEGNPSYYSVDNCLIQKSGSKLRYGCKNSIIPGDGSVLTIENQAFNGCVGLTDVYIPAVIQDIDTHAFFDCINIETITVEAGNAKYHSAGNCLIETAARKLVLACKNSVIPADGSVTTISSLAFFDATPVTSIVIPDSVTSLGYNTFDDIIALESVYLPGTLTELQTYCFDGCSNLKDIYFDGTIEQWNAVSKTDYWIDPYQSYAVHCTDGDVNVTY